MREREGRSAARCGRSGGFGGLMARRRNLRAEHQVDVVRRDRPRRRRRGLARKDEVGLRLAGFGMPAMEARNGGRGSASSRGRGAGAGLRGADLGPTTGPADRRRQRGRGQCGAVRPGDAAKAEHHDQVGVGGVVLAPEPEQEDQMIVDDLLGLSAAERPRPVFRISSSSRRMSAGRASKQS